MDDNASMVQICWQYRWGVKEVRGEANVLLHQVVNIVVEFEIEDGNACTTKFLDDDKIFIFEVEEIDSWILEHS